MIAIGSHNRRNESDLVYKKPWKNNEIVLCIAVIYGTNLWFQNDL